MAHQDSLPFTSRAAIAADVTLEGDVTIEGVLERIRFVNDDNGWSVVNLRSDATNQLITAVGVLPGVQVGEHLRLAGEWVEDRKWGRQFKCLSFLPISPSTLQGIERYLASGLIKGIGKEMARRLVKKFGIETLDVIEREPWRLSEVSGIGAKRRDQIVKAWKEQRAVKDVMIFLQTHGVTPGYAMKIFKRYGDRAINVVQQNPYRLAMDITGIGFRIADKIAMQLGIDRESPQRAEAGVLHTLRELADSGHVFAPSAELIRAAQTMLEVDTLIVETALKRLHNAQQVVVEPLPESTDSSAVYLGYLHFAESEAAEKLYRIANGPVLTMDIDVEAALNWVEAEDQITLADRQRDAIRRAVSSKLLVITGGPGTGKTTIVNSIIKIFKKKDRQILLAAPTGRAAKRMQEATGEEAKTIHRLLEFSPQTGGFGRDEDHPLEADLVVIDEVSMVDTMLLHFLVQAISPQSQLILVGDIDQLPSVGPGSVLRDVIQSGVADVVALTEIFRQAGASQIVVNAHRVNHGRLPHSGGDEGSDFFFIEREEPEDVLETIKNLVSRRIPQRFGLDPFREVQVLTPMHRGILGAQNLNTTLQALLNPTGTEITRGNRTFRQGDKVMQIRNNYDLDVYNGDIGVVLHVDPEDTQLVVRFEKDVTYEAEDLDELVTAYACSIHKSQGSEYPAVVIPIHTQHYVMLQRNLLYTAITRGRKLVILVGNKRALGICVRNNRVAQRYTRLADRLRV